MSLEAAAHVGHQVNHTSAFAGFVAGAVIGAIVAVGILAVVATGGLAAPAVLAAIGLGVGLGSFIGEQVGKRLIPPTPSGPITTGSPNVFINGRPGAFCSSDVACIKDATQKIAQGSATVGYNQLPAARVGDKGTCGFAVGEGSENVFIGGGMGSCGLEVGDEVPLYARVIVMAIGLLGGVVGMARAGICALGIAGRLAAGMVVGGAGSYAGGLLGGRLFGEGSFGQDMLSFLGGEAFSRMAFRGPLGRWMVGEPIDVVSGDVVFQQTDFVLPGALPLELNRFYSSGLMYDGCHGRKWASSWGQYVTIDSDYAYFHSDDGRRIPFELPEEIGVEVRHQYTNKFRLRKTENGFAVKNEQNQTLFLETKSGDRFLLSAVEDLNKHRIDFTHDEQGALREVKHSGGYLLAVEGPANQITRIELVSDDGSREELVRYDYDAGGGLSGVYNQSDLPMRFEYDAAARMTRWEDRRGTWFAYQYDDEGRCTRTRGINGMYSGSLEYNEQTLTNSYTDSLGNTTHYTYNGEFQVVRVVDPRGGEILCEYDERDNLTATIDALGNKTQFFHDADGNLIKRIDALGASFDTSFNQLHLPETLTDGLGNIVRREYDERGNLSKIVEPNGNFYRYERDEKANRARIINALNDECEIEYDAKGLIVSATDWNGNVLRLKRNTRGLVSEKTDSLNRKIRYEYAAPDRIGKVVLPNEATLFWEYDAEGNLVKFTDADQRVMRYEYGVFNQLIGEHFPDGTRRRYRCNSEARLSLVENELGEVHRYSHDANGQIVAERDFAGRVAHYELDLAGRCTKRINGAGQILTFKLDALGRVVSQMNAEGEESLYEYDANGSVLKATSADGVEVVFERNELGQVQEEKQNGRKIESDYDTLGRRIVRRTNDGEIKWRYDANGSPLEIQMAAGDNFLFEYDAANRETTRRLNGKLTTQKVYDSLDRLARQWTTIGGNGEFARLASHLSEQKYAYDESGNPLVIGDERRGETDYEYDLLGQVTRVRHNKREIENYRYDATGNITQALTLLGEVRDAAWQGVREIAAGGRLLRAGRIDYRYDADGRIVEKSVESPTGKIEHWRYEWTSEGRLRSVVNPQGEKWQYRYDAFGRRMEKSGASGATQYIWDGAAIVEETGATAAQWAYEADGFRPLAKISGGQTFAIVNDQTGKPLELFDETGAAAWQLQTSLWSVNIAEQTVRTDCDLRFQNQWLDRESGLHYNLNRYYDPQTARYISNDPIGFFGGFNTYAYAHNPLRFADPFGLDGTRGVYDVYHEAYIPRSMYRQSDGRHFSEANRQLYNAMRNDPALRTNLESRYPGIYDHVSPGRRGGFKPKAYTGTSWHHHPEVGGNLQLVDRADHNARHGDYHPKGYGGRNRWGGGTSCR